MTAVAGPVGEQPKGTVSETHAGAKRTGDVTCLAVRGRYAAIGIAWPDGSGQVLQLGDGIFGSVGSTASDEGDAAHLEETAAPPEHCPLPGDNPGFEQGLGSITIVPPPTDPAPPAITVPPAVVADATGPSGARVAFRARAHDRTDPLPGLSCSKRSRARFSIGRTTVSCRAHNAWHKTRTRTFAVRVRGADAQLVRLAAAARRHHHPALARRLNAALRAVRGHRRARACRSLRRRDGAAVRRVRAVLRCR